MFFRCDICLSVPQFASASKEFEGSAVRGGPNATGRWHSHFPPPDPRSLITKCLQARESQARFGPLGNFPPSSFFFRTGIRKRPWPPIPRFCKGSPLTCSRTSPFASTCLNGGLRQSPPRRSPLAPPASSVSRMASKSRQASRLAMGFRKRYAGCSVAMARMPA